MQGQSVLTYISGNQQNWTLPPGPNVIKLFTGVIEQQCRKTTVSSYHRCLINSCWKN